MSRKINVRSPFYLFYNDPLEPVYSYWLLQKCGTGSDTAFVRSTFTGFMNTNDSNSDLNASGYHLTENGVTSVYWVRRAATQSEWEQNSGTLDSFDVGNPSCNLCGCDENATTTTTTTSTTTAAPTTTTTTTTEEPTTTTSTTTEEPTTTNSTTTEELTTTTSTTTSTTTEEPTTTSTTSTSTAAPSCTSYTLVVDSGETTANWSYVSCEGTSMTWSGVSGDQEIVCAQSIPTKTSGYGSIYTGAACSSSGTTTTTSTTTSTTTEEPTTTTSTTTSTTTEEPTTTTSTTTTTTEEPTTTTSTTTSTTTGAPSTCHFVFVPDSQTTNNYGLSYYNGNTTLIYFYQLMGTTTVYQGVSGTVFGVCSQTTPLWFDYYVNAAVTDPSGVERPPNGGSCVSNGNCTYSAPATTTTSTTTTTTTTTTTLAPTTTTTTTAGPSCTEWSVSNEADEPGGFDGEYSYTDCSGTVQTGYLSFGQTAYVCAQSVTSVHPDITYYDTGTSC
jgi:hypothetical protein